MEVMQADSDFGDVILVENNTVGNWGVLYGDKGIYFEYDSDAIFCGRYFDSDNCYAFLRTTALTVHYSSQKRFPYGLFQSTFVSSIFKLRTLEFPSSIEADYWVLRH